MAPTPSSKANLIMNSRTPQSKHRLVFKESQPLEHPVEVVGRIRDYPDRKDRTFSALQLNPDRQSLRVKTETGYRDFRLDGVSLSEEEDLDLFYKKFIESRINGVKLGGKCTIMMYGPTGSGKSHTMFGCSKQPGIVYRSLKDILGEGDEGSEENGEKVGVGNFVQVTVVEIYNEEIYDLLGTNSGGGFGFGWSKGSASKVRLEVFGKKVKNANFISGNEAGKISKEIQKVERRRIVKSTLCNERSSRSHCMIILDVPTVGGRLMLVDMAGSENIEQAGQNGLEAKMQTAKINQGNIALKRVVESIANGDSHVPFRDSKLTMLLQDSFEDDKSKILMILCASPDPKELHKTIFTLEYGAKAKCIVRGPHTPTNEKDSEDSSSAVILQSRITALDRFIYKLQKDNKIWEKECNEAQKQLTKKEAEVAELRARLVRSEEEINEKVKERTQKLKNELEEKIQESQRIANEFVEMERKKMAEQMIQQQQEVEFLRKRLEEIEAQLCSSRGENPIIELKESSFTKRLAQLCSDEDAEMDMVKSMDLSKSIDMEMVYKNEEDLAVPVLNISNKVSLSTVFEEDEEDNINDEVQKEVIDEKTICCKTVLATPDFPSKDFSDLLEEKSTATPVLIGEDAENFRQKRIQNIFTLCGSYRHHQQLKNTRTISPPAKTILEDSAKENLPVHHQSNNLFGENNSGDSLEVCVKWEASKENPGKLITTLKVGKDSSLADLRKLIEIHHGSDTRSFAFLALGDPTGAPVAKEDEATTLTTKLPICNNVVNSRLACLRPLEERNQLPLSSLENLLLPATPMSNVKKLGVDAFSPQLPQHLSATPFVTAKRFRNNS